MTPNSEALLPNHHSLGFIHYSTTGMLCTAVQQQYSSRKCRTRCASPTAQQQSDLGSWEERMLLR